MTIVWMLLGLLVMLALRVPVAIALLVPCLIYVTADPSATYEVAAQQTLSGLNSFPLLAVPLFIMLGNIANVSGISDRLFNAATALIGHVRGSLGYVNVATSFGFAWMSGAAISDAAALGRVQVPAMVKRGYSQQFSVGITGASSLIAPILPPSIPAIIYAVTAGLSVGALFMAGIIPALLIVLALCIMVWVMTRKRDDLRLQRVRGKQRWMPMLGALPGLGAGVVVLGGILGGIFTPTEAAGIGVVYMFLLAAAYQRMNGANLKYVLRTTLETSGSVLIIVAAASLFGWVLAREQAPQRAAELILGITTNPIVFLLLLNILLLIVGAIIEPTAAILILVPVLAPVATQYGLDPLHVGAIVIFNLMIGLLTPPVGLVLFVLSSVTDIPVSKVIKGVMPFFIPMVLVLLLITFFPFFTTWLPGLLGP
ncbi:TRAP transporter large permease [Microcella alkaliphila]|jgi:tripartite ATP-independent transporter DctM subunit|uniref:TRAP C4-dicarboxylate transport system permease DctM n=1 Tax=Microcella alkaliphila TaxID=279828 RepID=A0A0U5BFG3_9MICO|nr:TRAP transporter large permease [Microcella alkaliphila]BAU33313.1 TRAP C4-dicarboxylate transport system permease DctM [Microcella alkaliphila]